MKLVTNRFEAVKAANPNYSTYLVFANVILSVTVAPQTITKAFDLLVDKKDYLPSEKDAILAHLQNMALQRA